MKKSAMLVTLCITLLSCHRGNNLNVPSDIIQPDSMVQVLTDVHIFQATLQLGYFRNDSATAAKKAFIDILKKHHLSENDYKKATEFYSYHPAILDSVYEKVLDNLSQQKAELLGKKKHP